MITPSLPNALGFISRSARFLLSTISKEDCRSCECEINPVRGPRYWQMLEAQGGERLPAYLHRLGQGTFSDALCHECFVDLGERRPLVGFLDLGVEHDNRALIVASGVAYHGPIVQLLHRYKYQEDRLLTPDLTDLMLNAWNILAPYIDYQRALFVPVPLHWRRHMKRGFNQSELLAREAAKYIGIRVQADALKRTRLTPPQHSLSKFDRASNLFGAFKGSKTLLQDRCIILVDDICTSGATLSACATAAVECGARRVTALTVARTPLWHSPAVE